MAELTSSHFTLGQTIMIERRIGKLQNKSESQIVGIYDPYYLIAELPVQNGRPRLTEEDKQCIVRTVCNGSAVGFRARIESIQMRPFPMVFLIYPREYEEVSIRENDRIDCCIPMSFVPLVDTPTAPSDEKTRSMTEIVSLPTSPLAGNITDLSAGGCQVAIPLYNPENFPETLKSWNLNVAPEHYENYNLVKYQLWFARGGRASIDLTLPEPAYSQYPSTQCEIRWVRNTNETFQIGMRFLHPSVEMQTYINKIVAHQNRFFRRAFV
jgi:c-di-GMP-binding flagellar brake protein YcgR